jgi:hypothetical protein
MQSLLTFLVQLSGKAWTALVVAVLSGGGVIVYYFSSANAASNSIPANLPAVVPPGPVANLGSPADRHPGPVSVVPEANAGQALLPVMAAVAVFSSRRLWTAKSSAASDD